MKTALEIRSGNVIMYTNSPWVVLKTEINKSGRNTAIVRTKLKNILNGANSEIVFKADDKVEDIILDCIECTYSYFADPAYVFVDADYNQYDVDKDNLGDVLNYITDGMEDVCQVTFYEGKALSVELPNTIVREIGYTEPAARGDTSGKVMKRATIAGSEFELNVPDFVKIGDKIEIDSRTGEFKKRV